MVKNTLDKVGELQLVYNNIIGIGNFAARNREREVVRMLELYTSEALIQLADVGDVEYRTDPVLNRQCPRPPTQCPVHLLEQTAVKLVPELLKSQIRERTTQLVAM